MRYFFLLILVVTLAGCKTNDTNDLPVHISGIYPHLAYYNNEGECGTGAVVPWAGRLWVITYGPHLPFGSSDKLYEITPALQQIVRDESIGGTPANRMIHMTSKQLFIGPYVIDAERKVRVIPYHKMPGRLTGNAAHLSDPLKKIYYGTMEEGFYEVDVNTLEVTTLYQDGNVKRQPGEMAQYNALLPGAHGKGLYSGQGVLVYSNNGEASREALERFDAESGSLAEWNGTDWKIIRRNQFVEVTGPGGIYGNQDPETDPIWVTGWDHKSVLVGVRNKVTGWNFYRLPKASHSYDGAHGWNTEWPRIRDVGTKKKPDYLMTMHGLFWRFPAKFTNDNSYGIRPRSAYLKVIGDFARWNDQIVFGCDDAANSEFLNKRKIIGSVERAGQSNSNLWFTSIGLPDSLGPVTADGAVWLNEEVRAGEDSEPFLFEGWDIRACWIYNHGKQDVTFTFTTDRNGNNQWEILKAVKIKAGDNLNIPFSDTEKGEWIRVSTDKSTKATVHFTYTDRDMRLYKPDKIFEGISPASETRQLSGLLWGTGNDKRTLGLLAGTTDNQKFHETGYYELDRDLRLKKKEDTSSASFIRRKMQIPEKVIEIDKASVLITDDKGRRWRLPKGNSLLDSLSVKGLIRICREVVTERDILNCSGTFYELPAENADGFAKIRPVASHNFRIADFTSYSGMLVITGISETSESLNEHVIRSDDGKAAVWVGVVDDLWKLGKPVGEGGPWKDTSVRKGEPSDPYLSGFYDNKTLMLSHLSDKPLKFTIEADPTGQGPWMRYKEITVDPGQEYKMVLPDHFQARWIRFTVSEDCIATAWLIYS